MDFGLPDGVEQKITRLEGMLESLEASLSPALSQKVEDVDEQLSPLQGAQWHATMASAAFTLFELYLKTRGKDPKKIEALEKERKRLTHYESKVGKVVNKEELASSSRSVSVNIQAANRFIDQALPDLTPEQRQQLRQSDGTAKTAPSTSQMPAQNKAPPTKQEQKKKAATLGFLKEILEDAKQMARTPAGTESTAEVGNAEKIEIDGTYKGAKDDSVSGSESEDEGGDEGNAGTGDPDQSNSNVEQNNKGSPLKKRSTKRKRKGGNNKKKRKKSKW